MIEHVLLLPTMVYAHQKYDASLVVDELMRDFAVIILVNILERMGYQIFRRIFVSLTCFGLIADIVNDLVHREPNPLYLNNWKHVHQNQMRDLLFILQSTLYTTKGSRNSDYLINPHISSAA